MNSAYEQLVYESRSHRYLCPLVLVGSQLHACMLLLRDVRGNLTAMNEPHDPCTACANGRGKSASADGERKTRSSARSQEAASARVART